jgi:hypothetical protein
MIKFIFVLAGLVSPLAIAQNYTSETAEATSLVQNSDIQSSYHYCLASKLTCRTLVLLKQKNTGAAKEDFYDVFVSSERAVGSTGYFVKNSGNRFHAYLDDTFDGQIGITKKYDENQNLKVTFDGQFPTIHDVYLKRLGTTRYIVADMAYSSSQATIIGTELDSADPNYAVGVSIIYDRIQQ